MTTHDITPQPEQRKNKRRAVLAFALAALAVGGIGAAATSAAWTDNVFFSAQAEAATFDLEGRVGTSGTWHDTVANEDVHIVVGASEFANLLPNQERIVTLQVRNQGTVPATLVNTAAFTSTSTFASNPGVTITGPTTVAAGATITLTLTVTTDADWAPANQGKNGTVLVTIAGTAVATL